MINQLIKAESKSIVILHHKKEKIIIRHSENVMIVETKNPNIFKRAITITLTEMVTVNNIVLDKGTKGKLMLKRVYFWAGNKFIGLGDDYLRGKMDTLVVLC